MIIVTGTFRVPEDKVDELTPVARSTIAATTKEAGCIVYSFSANLADRGLIHIYEEWESRAHLDAHLKQPHMGPWRAKLAEIGATGRDVKTVEAGEITQL